MSFCRFEWGGQSLEAAWLLADQQLTNQQIADKVGVTPARLSTWRQHPEFKAKIVENLREIEKEIMGIGIALKQNRLRRLNDHWNKCRDIVAQRAVAYGNDAAAMLVPGTDTGLIVPEVKQGRGGPYTVWKHDSELEQTLLSLERQAAQEMGHWVKRTDVTSDGKAVKVFLGIDRSLL